MEMNSINKKLLKTALYTSPLIAIICLAPVTIAKPSLTTPAEILAATIVVLCIWFINFGVYYLYGSGKRVVQLRYLLSYLLVFGVMFFIKYLVNFPDYPDFALIELPNQLYTDPGWALFFSINTIILIIQNLHIIREKKAVIELENARLKLCNAEAMNQKLKQQIRPHFLFNSLNTLKTLTKKEPRTATDYVVQLSGFLRSSLSSTNVNTVKLGEELDLCMGYLEMQKIRFQSSLEYNFSIPAEVRKSGFVPPFSIQLLLENAIKHNSMSRETPLYIQVMYEEEWINVRNNKQERNMSEPSSGMGLDNLAERYQILSGDEIVIEPDEDQFSVSIKVLNQEPSIYLQEEYEMLSDQ